MNLITKIFFSHVVLLDDIDDTYKYKGYNPLSSYGLSCANCKRNTKDMCKNDGPVSGVCGMFYPFMLEWDHHIKKFGEGENEYVKNTLDEIPINRIFLKSVFNFVNNLHR